MEQELQLFCMDWNHKKCIEQLRLMLSKDEQISEYDSIYENYHGPNDLHSLIPNLNRKIKFMALCKYYSDELFYEFENSKTDETWLLSLFNQDYSIHSFLYTSYQICNIRNRNKMPYIIRQPIPENRKCFPYILLDKAGLVSFGTMINLLFGNSNFTRIPICFLFNDSEKGPHGNRFNSPETFFNHDLGHYYTTLNCIKKYDINLILDILPTYPDRTIKRNILNVYLHTYIFEENMTTLGQNLNIFDNFNEKFLNIVNEIDQFDHRYFFSYLMKSIDIDDYLKLKYIEYKEQFSKIEQESIILLKRYDESEYMYLNQLMLKEDFLKIEDKLFEKRDKMTELSSEFIKEFLRYLD